MNIKYKVSGICMLNRILAYFFRKPDFNKTAMDYSKYRRGFPVEFFNYLQVNGIIRPKYKVVDLGTGTGVIANQLAILDCDVTGIDPSSALLNEAKRQNLSAGTKINYFLASAEATGLLSSSFDVVVAGQAWHWFQQNEAINEVKRILKPNGSLIIAHYEWTTEKNSVPELTEQLMKKYNPEWKKVSVDSAYYRQLQTTLNDNQFETKLTTIDVMEEYTQEQWCGRVRASPVVSGVLDERTLKQFDREHAKKLSQNFSQTLAIKHRCSILTAHQTEFISDKSS
jgi:ubiquinone/menaquinone biosynthesis C-methylase UbiE